MTNEALLLHKAGRALEFANCPTPLIAAAAPVVAKYLAMVDGEVVVVGGQLVAAGKTWRATDGDGTPRTIPDLGGSGRPLPFPVSRLIEELCLIDGGIRWRMPA